MQPSVLENQNFQLKEIKTIDFFITQLIKLKAYPMARNNRAYNLEAEFVIYPHLLNDNKISYFGKCCSFQF